MQQEKPNLTKMLCEWRERLTWTLSPLKSALVLLVARVLENGPAQTLG